LSIVEPETNRRGRLGQLIYVSHSLGVVYAGKEVLQCLVKARLILQV
jgi:hypothetical protein